MKTALFLLFIVAMPAMVYGQERDLGNWIIFFGDKKIKQNWNWHHEIQYRSYNAISDLEQLLLRSGIGYDLSNNNNVLFGYAYIHSQNYISGDDNKQKTNEHRLYQQFITRQQFGRVYMQHRYRFEQRFIETNFKLRFRYFLSINIPLNHPTMLDRTVYLSSYNEIFLNTEDTIFDRNRLYGGIGYRLNGQMRFEAGYMNQFLTDGGRDQINLIAFINF
ncbi:MAG: DUF2490 domain-containing protein [Cyclobacteriaceae bacterium]|nr:DUF2490 domain-containing protein [Cyclobacteriaceae bacterium]